MKRSTFLHLFCLSFLAITSTALLADPAPAAKPDAKPAKAPTVLMKTSEGDIVIELDPKSAPITVKNFLAYVNKKFYDGTIFHRVIPGFVIQGGGFSTEMTEKPTDAPITNEATNGLHNSRGTLSMARTSDPNSATSQFFVNLVDNTSKLDQGGVSPEGYAVFGKVTKGLEVVDKIAAIPTGPGDVPTKQIVIISARAE